MSDHLLYGWIPSTHVVWYDGAAERVLGYTVAELGTGIAQWLDLIHPEDRASFQREIDRVVQARAIFHLRYRVRRKDGTFIFVEDVGQFVRDAAGGPDRMLGFITDVTQQIKNERDVERQADFARFNPNPVMELAASGAINFANDAAYDMMRALGEPLLTAILPPDTARILERCLSAREPVLRVEIELKGRMLSWSFFPIPDRSIVHCYGADVSERKRLENQFRHAQKMEALGLLSGGIAHDFNNLLTVIQGQVGLMEISPKMVPQLLPHLSGIKEAASRAAGLTRQLLTISRNQPLQMKPVDLRQIVTDITGLLRRVLGEDITVGFELSPEPQWVRADPSMMEQIVLNLAVNARDAMPGGGRLTVRLETLTLEVPGSGRREDFTRWVVGDTGVGIPRDILGNIFDPFFTTKGTGKGSGLGLATVYSIVQQHGGRIEVKSELGQGTQFEILLPRTYEAPHAAPRGPAATVTGGAECILVVEDEALVRELIEATLGKAGYRVLSASDANAAATLWRGHESKIALLVTDLVMPGGVSGRALAEQLQKERPALKVLFISGYSPEREDPAPMQPGTTFLAKPFSPLKLLQTVRASLDRSPAVASAS